MPRLSSLLTSLRPADVAFTVASVAFAFLALHADAVRSADLWPHAYFLAMGAQWAALAIACVDRRGVPPRARPANPAITLSALLLFHGLVLVASVLLGLADAMVGGAALGGPAEAIPPQGQLATVLVSSWALLLAAAVASRTFRALSGRTLIADAPVVVAALAAGAIAYWGWGWSRFFPTQEGQWFSLWQVGSLNVAVDGAIFALLLVAVPVVHVAVVLGAAASVLRAPAPSV